MSTAVIPAERDLWAGAPGPEADGLQGASWRVYDSLRSQILAMAILPDTTLNRADLAAEYGVSQTPVREALQFLEQDGLVRIYPQSRTVVARINVRELNEAQFLRVALETEVMRRIAGAQDEGAIARAASILKMMEALGSDPAELPYFHQLDREFHGTFFAAVGMGGLHRLLLRRLGHLNRCQRLELPRPGKMQEILDAHHEILRAARSGDPERAAQAMRRHITGTINRVDQLREEYPDYFTET